MAKIIMVNYMNNVKQHLKSASLGVAVGLVNGVFGAGGGMIAVPLLKKCGLDQKSAHSNAVAVILPITLLSAILYLAKGTVTLSDSFAFVPTGIIGSIIATFALQKFSNALLQKVFAAFMIYAGIRGLTR
ncbi:MAG: sulfite exporter TauE/SafE family protein [Clostridia bacterium]|nr:sulfite exporter TauE/SafE family protein [Clostridia bacterium]